MDAFSCLSVLPSRRPTTPLVLLVAVEAFSAIFIPQRRYQEVIGIIAAVTIAAYIGFLFARLQ